MNEFSKKNGPRLQIMRISFYKLKFEFDEYVWERTTLNYVKHEMK